MPIPTFQLKAQDELNNGLEQAGKESKATKIVTADGQIFIVFPEDGMDRMCEVVQSPEFTKSLKEGFEQYQKGEVKFVKD